ncbi:MAG: inositol monophosphatase family protein [Candidatus Nanoarchaeia archaeon]
MINKKQKNQTTRKDQTLNLEEAEKFIQQITISAGKIVAKLYGKIGVAYTKADIGDVVTKADLLSNEFIISSIKKKYPEHGIISEETKREDKKTEYTWIIDPLDGTRNYSTKTPMYGIIVALAKKEEVILGAVYLPEMKELYFARKGKGTYLNGKRINCSNTKNLEFSYGTEGGNQSSNVAYIYGELLEQSKKSSFWINTMGCGAFSSALVSSGRRDWLVNPRAGGVWDFAGPVIILKESGCLVTNLDGKPWSIKDLSIVAANPVLHRELMKIITLAKKKNSKK